MAVVRLQCSEGEEEHGSCAELVAVPERLLYCVSGVDCVSGDRQHGAAGAQEQT